MAVIIAGAGGAAHLPGMVAAQTSLPVLGVPMESHALKGQDSLLSIVQMPAGVPVGTLAIGRAGAVNAALLAASILAGQDDNVRAALDAWRARQRRRSASDRLTTHDGPGARRDLGIVGGGQLGRMTALAAARLGYRCHVFTPEADSPAGQVAAAVTCAEYDDLAALARFAAAVDAVTYEFENIPLASIRALDGKVPTRPGPRALKCPSIG